MHIASIHRSGWYNPTLCRLLPPSETLYFLPIFPNIPARAGEPKLTFRGCHPMNNQPAATCVGPLPVLSHRPRRSLLPATGPPSKPPNTTLCRPPSRRLCNPSVRNAAALSTPTAVTSFVVCWTAKLSPDTRDGRGAGTGRSWARLVSGRERGDKHGEPAMSNGNGGYVAGQRRP